MTGAEKMVAASVVTAVGSAGLSLYGVATGRDRLLVTGLACLGLSWWLNQTGARAYLRQQGALP